MLLLSVSSSPPRWQHGSGDGCRGHARCCCTADTLPAAAAALPVSCCCHRRHPRRRVLPPMTPPCCRAARRHRPATALPPPRYRRRCAIVTALLPRCPLLVLVLFFTSTRGRHMAIPRCEPIVCPDEFCFGIRAILAFLRNTRTTLRTYVQRNRLWIFLLNGCSRIANFHHSEYSFPR